MPFVIHRIILLFSVSMFLTLPPSFASAQKTLVTQSVRKPSKDFLEFGDVIGVSQAVLDGLGIEEGDPVMVTAPSGVSGGFRTKLLGNFKEAIYAKETIRTVLGITDGEVQLTLSAIKFGPGPAKAMDLTFHNVVRPPEMFLDLGETVGVPLETFRKTNSFPGCAGRLTGPAGSIEVRVELLDRGGDTISMKKALRDSLGVPEGEADLTLQIYGNQKPPTKAATGGEHQPMKWNAYNPYQVEAYLDQHPSAVVYVRSESVPNCKDFEKAYLLNDDLNATFAYREIFFIEASTDKHANFLQEHNVLRVPCLVKVRKDGTFEPMDARNATPETLRSFLQTM